MQEDELLHLSVTVQVLLIKVSQPISVFWSEKEIFNSPGQMLVAVALPVSIGRVELLQATETLAGHVITSGKLSFLDIV